jgi:hypothetical protein
MATVEGSVVKHQGKGLAAWRKVVTVLATSVIALALAMDVSDLVGYLRNPGAYPIGVEAAGLRYASRIHFISVTSGTTVLCAIGLIGPMFMMHEARKNALRVAVALWVVMSTAWFIFTTG